VLDRAGAGLVAREPERRRGLEALRRGARESHAQLAREPVRADDASDADERRGAVLRARRGAGGLGVFARRVSTSDASLACGSLRAPAARALA
jgi:hypothetical protein